MKKLLWVAVATLATTFFLVGRSADRGPAIVFDRLWIDHLPRSESDVFRFFLVFTEQERGVFNQQTVWKGEWEAFRLGSSGLDRSDLPLLLAVPGACSLPRMALLSAGYTMSSSPSRRASFCREASQVSIAAVSVRKHTRPTEGPAWPERECPPDTRFDRAWQA